MPEHSGTIEPGGLRLIRDEQKLAARCRELLEAELPSIALPHLHYLEHLELERPEAERSSETALLLGECYLRLGYPAKAQKTLLEALARIGASDPRATLRAHLLLAAVLLESRSFAEAATSTCSAEAVLATDAYPLQRFSLRLIQCDLARLQGDYVVAGGFLDEAKDVAADLNQPGPRARAILAEAQLAWARGELHQTALLLFEAEHKLAAAGLKHLHGEACLICATFVGDCATRGLLEPDWPLEVPAAIYLVRAQELFTESGSLRDLERVRRHFRLFGRRATDRVADEAVAQRAEQIGLEHLDLDSRINTLVPSMNKIMAEATSRGSHEEVLEAIWSEIISFRADILRKLMSLARGNDRLVDAAHAVLVERNQLRDILEGVRRLGGFADVEQLNREVVELTQSVVNADHVVLAFVDRLGELAVRERRGSWGEDDRSWRFLAEQARRTGRALLQKRKDPGDQCHLADPDLPYSSPTSPFGEGNEASLDLGSAMAVPIHDSQGVRGVIYADRLKRGRLITRRDLGLLEVVASQIGSLLERQRMNWSLRVAARVREATMEAIGDGVIAFGTDSQIRSVNSAAAKMLMLSTRELEGRTVQDISALRDVTAGLKDLEELDGRMVRLPGGEVMVGARVVRDDDGHPAGTVLTFTGKRRAQRTAHKLAGARARYTFEEILGVNPVFLEQVMMGKVAARSDSGVLITGESGTGKEVIAQAIHNASARAWGPFVGINCAAIPRDLLESELFGHEEGAFTGACRGGQPGKFELAEGGTILLDEIGDMPIEMQAKLLRVLQERRYQRVGGRSLLLLDARIIATTNQDLDILVDDRRFRSDLLFRLKVMHLHLPPLRERPEDIPVFVTHFLKRSASRMGKRLARVSASVKRAFMAYPWPGNVRELEYVIESEVNMAEPHQEELVEIPAALRVQRRRRRRKTLVGMPIQSEEPAPPRRGPITLANMEKELLVAALTEHAGNVPAVADALGVSRGTVYNKLRKLGLDLASYRRGSCEGPA